MAFGSATVRTQTTTKTTIKTKTTTSSSTSSAVASTSKLPTKGRKLGPVDRSASSQSHSHSNRRESQPDPPGSSSDDDPDFGAGAKEEVKKEAEELRQKEAIKREKEEEKKARAAAKESGEVYKPKPKPKVKKEPKVKGAPRRAKPEPKADSSDDSDGGGIRPTRPSLDYDAKRKEVQKMLRIKIGAGRKSRPKDEVDDGDSDGDLADERVGQKRKTAGSKAKGKGKRQKVYGSDEEGRSRQIEDHVRRRWADKHHPERMSASRKKMEEKYNPLIKLLDIKIIVTDGEESDIGSDDSPRIRRVHTDSEDDVEPVVVKAKNNSLPRKGLATPLLDKLQNKLAPEVKVEQGVEVKVKNEDVQLGIKVEEDVKPDVAMLTLSDSDDVPEPDTESDSEIIIRPIVASLSSPPDTKPLLPLLSKVDEVDVKPVIHPSLKGKEKATDQDAAMPSLSSDDDYEPEPDTEDDTTIPTLAAAVGESVSTSFMQLDSDSEPEPDTEEDVKMGIVVDDDDDDEAMDEFTRRFSAAKTKEMEQRNHRQYQRDLEARAKERAEEDEKKAMTQDSDVEDLEEEEDKPEMSFLEARSLAASLPQTVYPISIKKGRPKFKIMDRKQDLTGPHVLSPTAEIPAPLNKFLRDYQRQGVDFLYRQYEQGMGGILGDDMGLGKTIQVIAFLSAVMGKKGLKKHDAQRRKRSINELARGEAFPAPSAHGQTCLVICPASVVRNWEREFETWSYLDVRVYGGAKRQEVLKMFSLGYIDVLIAGIEAVRSNIDELIDHDFSMIIVDEAHRVKNPLSQTTMALHQFPTKLRYGLTGTAIQNGLDEFWCILDWAVPGKVGSRQQWRDFVARPLKFTQKANATDDELATGRIRAAALVTKLLPNFWLRRTKHDPSVKLQLPKKIDNVILCPLTDLQKSVYTNMLDLEDVKIILTADDPCPCGARDGDGLPFRRGKCCEEDWVQLIFKYMTLFQKIANHLALIYPDKEDIATNKKKYDQDVEWVKAAFPEDYYNRKQGPATAIDSTLCGKWKILCEMLEIWSANGDKVLIFSMSLKILALLRDLFEETNYSHITLDGNVPNDRRMELVDRFNDPDGGVFCFLLSTRAGGVGLNLTAANRVVIFDPNWNPSHDLQAMDRSYRFGQTREVHVYRMVGAGTLEELIINRQQAKRALAGIGYDASAERRLYTGVEGEGKEQAGELYGVKNIFKFSEHFSLTEKAIKNCEIAELDYAFKHTALKDDENWDAVEIVEEPEADEVVKDLFGIGGERLCPAEAARAKKVQEEKEMIARVLEGEKSQIDRILNGVYKVVSDSTLGSSKAEEARARQAILDQQNRPKAKGHASLPDTRKVVKAGSSTEDKKPLTNSEWNPLARGKKGLKTVKREDGVKLGDASPSIPSVDVDKPETMVSLRSSLGIPDDVSTADIIARSGYMGSRGGHKLSEEMSVMSDRGKKERLRELMMKYMETMKKT